MPSPAGIFIGLSLDELQAEKEIALDRIRYGDRTGMGGAGKSSSRSFSLDARSHLREVNFALLKLTGTARPSRTYFDASGQDA